MTEEAKNEQEVEAGTAQKYLEDVIQKFNLDPESPELEKSEKILIGKMVFVQKSIADLTQQIEELNTEIRERQNKGQTLVQQLTHSQGLSQGYIDSLLALK